MKKKKKTENYKVKEWVNISIEKPIQSSDMKSSKFSIKNNDFQRIQSESSRKSLVLFSLLWIIIFLLMAEVYSSAKRTKYKAQSVILS